MNHGKGRVGVDVGSLFAKAVRLDSTGRIVEAHYRRHRGELDAAFDGALSAVRFQPGDSLGVTGSAARPLAEAAGLPFVDLVRCQIEAVRAELGSVVEIFDIGGGSCTLIQLDAQGRFQGYSGNSLCAAGTGSFLDEQGSRLGISYEDMVHFRHVDDPPTIATRCSVFAKSDLIHRQQEGYSKPAMWSGLCRGMTRTLIGTLLSGRPLSGRTAVIGGVAQNQSVLRWLRERFGDLIVVPASPHLAAALGGALLGSVVDRGSAVRPAKSARREGNASYAWPLTMEKSTYPSFVCADSFTDEHGSEVRVLSVPAAGSVPVFFGIDVGSTSTKVAVVDLEERVLVDVYRKTAGDPLAATNALLHALRAVAARLGITWDIRGVGTTGSGRALVGAVIGADAVVNEISAHVAGAVRCDPTIDTIFEIGGQDSKYMHVVDGHIRDANMNYVCAAGTGSFVEEQAQKLGYPVGEVGRAVLGLKPPRASDRCTVFMEQDVAALIQAGASLETALAGVMVAVVKNYLNKVVGNRYRSRTKIFFQGATARNPALVAAFERLLDVRMVVSPYCHVMGSYGVALLTRRTMEDAGKHSSSFRGLDFELGRTRLRKETCSLCQNDCVITYADIDGVPEAPSWGYMCGREPSDERMRVSPHARYLRARQKLWREAGRGAPKLPDNAPVVGIPLGLANHTFAPMWRRFFNELGYRVLLSPPTDDGIRELGSRLAGAEFCFPAKVALGHVAHLATRAGVDFIFLPHLANEQPKPGVSAATYCPYIQAWPAYSRSALALNGLDTVRILTPLIDKRMPKTKLVAELTAALAAPLQRSSGQLAVAWDRAVEAHQDFEQRCYEAGDQALAEARARGERLLVLIGRPYNMTDSGLNLDLPLKIAERGVTVVPMDFVRPDLSRIGERYKNVYWAYGQKIIAVLEQVATSELLDAVYLTNFGCGPDSFLLSYAEEIMGKRPFLALELDEHGGDAGYLTRIEAFLDVLKRSRGLPSRRPPYRPAATDMKARTLWIPPMHEFGAELFAAAFRHHGYDARALPPETTATFELGRSLTRGSECLPTALTIGALLATLREHGLRDRQALLMPTACGPCRFGQYCQLHRQILDREGYHDVAILSPSSINAYQGVDDKLRRTLFKSIVVGDLLLKARCKVRPYEVNKGETDRIMAEERARLGAIFEKGASLLAPVRSAVDRIAAIPRVAERRPHVGIVGEIYVRNNPFSNENLISAIEQLGGEAWPTPMAEWIMFLASPRNFLQYLKRTVSLEALKAYLTYRWQRHWDHALYAAAGSFLADRREPDINEVLDEAEFYLRRNIGGEALSILGRTVKFAREGAAMVVNCAPFGCMPGTITTAVFRHVSTVHRLPIINMFYDGQGNQNQRLAVFLNNAVRRWRQADVGPDHEGRAAA